MNKRILALILVVLTLLCSVATASLELGRRTFAHRPAARLGADVPFGSGARALGSGGFVRRVGGVAFGAVAEPAGSAPSSLVLEYRSRARDGHRVKVVLDGVSHDLDMPDWVVLPTAKWADQDTIELVTAFGELRDPMTDDEKECSFVFNYAKEVDGTLAGLRLMQADLIGISEDYGDLVRDGRRYVLGTGEAAPTANEVAVRAERLSEVMDDVRARFVSYILTDVLARIEFEGRDGHIAFTGGPTYRLWRTAGEQLGWDGRIALADQIDALTRTEQREKAHALQEYIQGKLDEPGWSEAQRASTAKAVDGLVHTIASDIVDDETRGKSLFSLSLTALDLEVSYLSDDENPLSDPDTIASLNPTVYRAVESISRAAAFFRYVKIHHPDAWQSFLRKISRQRAPRPRVTLPTSMPKGCAADPFGRGIGN